MASGYFDSETVNGFTLRTFWEEKNGVLTVPNVQLRSKEYTGPTWYPKGEIAVNGVPILKMDYANPATHAFSVYAAGDTFLDIEVLSGQTLPVSSEVIKTGKAVITVNVELYRNSSTSKPVLTGSAEIRLTAGTVRVQTAGGVKRHRVSVIQDGEPVPMAAVVKQGGGIKYCT